jgi:flagellar capping protein FliD
VISTINTQYVVDPTGSIPAPPLESDISLRSLQSRLLSDASYAIGGNGGLVNLASLGINQNNDGTLTVGTTPVDSSNPSNTGQTFAQVLSANPSAVQNFFQNASGTGFANVFNTDLTALTDPTQGPLNVDLTQNQSEQADLTTTISAFETQLNTETAALTAEYDSVNASLQAYPLLLQVTTETLGTLGSGTSTSGALISSGPTLTSGL